MKLTQQQQNIVDRMRAHGQPVHHTAMGYEIDGRYLCNTHAMTELVTLKQVTRTYVDRPNGSRISVYQAVAAMGG